MLNQNQINEISQAVRELTEAPSCCAEAREAAERWLAAAGTPAEAEASKALVAEMEDDLVTVDGLIAFAESEAGIGHFGAETARSHRRPRQGAEGIRRSLLRLPRLHRRQGHPGLQRAAAGITTAGKASITDREDSRRAVLPVCLLPLPWSSLFRPSISLPRKYAGRRCAKGQYSPCTPTSGHRLYTTLS